MLKRSYKRIGGEKKRPLKPWPIAFYAIAHRKYERISTGPCKRYHIKHFIWSESASSDSLCIMSLYSSPVEPVLSATAYQDMLPLIFSFLYSGLWFVAECLSFNNNFLLIHVDSDKITKAHVLSPVKRRSQGTVAQRCQSTKCVKGDFF